MSELKRTSRTSITVMERPLGQMRWKQHSPLPGHRTLQQAWETVAYEGGEPYQQDIEWRDVPTVRE